MIENYKSFLKSFRKEDEIPFNCPECNKPTLSLEQTTWLQKEQISSILERKQIHEFEPEWVKYTYTGTFKCMNPNCGELVVTAGSGSVIDEYTDYCLDDDGYPGPCASEYVDIFYPKYFYPTLKFFDIPKSTPEDIKNIIIDAFSLTPNSSSAAANKIRIAVEMIATEYGIPAQRPNGTFSTLSERINKMDPQNELFIYKDLMTAIKWIGNSGSHEDDLIDINALFDSFQIIEELLKSLYSDQNKVQELVEFINDKRKPLSKRDRSALKSRL